MGTDVRRSAGWLPEQDQLEEWLTGHRDRVERSDAVLHPAVRSFQELIADDPLIRMNLERAISEVPANRAYAKRHVRDLAEMLQLINAVLTTAPEFDADSMVITPIGAVLDWASATPSGFAAFRDPRVNAALREILNAWSEFLTSPDSRYVLNDSENGWCSEAARKAVGIDDFVHDPADPHWGFTSWNDFFTRRLAPGRRPVDGADDDRIVVSACEATPYALRSDVRRCDRFWAKEESYSLYDLLAGDEATDAFVGGTVYQAYLSATNYHRWHSPVSGTIVRAFVEPGTYYSEADSQGAAAAEPQQSQGYLAHVATRAIVVIEADHDDIGLVAFVAVGMSDVSSCIIGDGVTPGAHLHKGDELGYFQFGGSTWCLVLRPGVVADVAAAAVPQPGDPDAPLLKVNARLVTAAIR